MINYDQTINDMNFQSLFSRDSECLDIPQQSSNYVLNSKEVFDLGIPKPEQKADSLIIKIYTTKKRYIRSII